MQLSKWEKTREAATAGTSADAAPADAASAAEAAVTTQPTATEPKKPPTLKEKIETNVVFNGCCGVCSLLCICTIPMLIVVLVASLVLCAVSWDLSTET